MSIITKKRVKHSAVLASILIIAVLVSFWSLTVSNRLELNNSDKLVTRSDFFEDYGLPSNAPGNLFVDGRNRSNTETADVKEEKEVNTTPIQLVSVISVHSQPYAVFLKGTDKITAAIDEKIDNDYKVKAITPTSVTVTDTSGENKTFMLFPTNNAKQKGKDNE
ncbi:hypothetical protein BZJ17_13160 [Salinivibrio sp. IB574]|uniref:hypothetical protein n=1 Tax=Salinivibrio sp. IB574 TaxID=1909444 RepID=UPI000988B0EC|nr:hypothetical protein [Salinivibrio sp. IB574]OOF20399.1 hypothetical protein BZJ17_13160 [Salinivibrio sp. IB574]